jgi:hypothetical protein
VIVVLADDPRRTEFALELWRRESFHSLWVLGDPLLQQATWRQVLARNLAIPANRYQMLLEGSDTVGQLTALARVLPSTVCAVQLITDSAHRDRALAIARFALGGGHGAWVDSPPGSRLPPVSQPEARRRLWRDVLRVQLWRATGWDGRALGLWLRREQIRWL